MLEFTEIIKLSGGADISRGCVVAVGSFDGVHLGHRALLARLASESKKYNLPAVVFTFGTADGPKSGFKQLAQSELKPLLLASEGVNILISAQFSAFKGISARDFAVDFLYGELGAKSIVCGYDFRFGNNREGDIKLLSELLSDKGVEVISASATTYGGLPVSSTLIRGLVSDGDVKKAGLLLGREFSFFADICRGARLGRKIGFPTVNQLYSKELVVPKYGVYAVKVKLGNKVYGGVANVGLKPTVGGVDAPLCETHIFGYSGDCYGQTAEIRFVEFIRAERRFGSVDELAAQIKRDKEAAAEIFEGECL